MYGRVPGIIRRHPGIAAEIVAIQEHHPQVPARQLNFLLDIHHRILRLKGVHFAFDPGASPLRLDDAHATRLGGIQGFEHGTAKFLYGGNRRHGILGDAGRRHGDAGVAQGHGTTQAVDQAQDILCPTEDPHPGLLGHAQQFQPIQGIGTIKGTDLLDDQRVQLTQILVLE